MQSSIKFTRSSYTYFDTERSTYWQRPHTVENIMREVYNLEERRPAPLRADFTTSKEAAALAGRSIG